jgi:hypothetical protein
MKPLVAMLSLILGSSLVSAQVSPVPITFGKPFTLDQGGNFTARQVATNWNLRFARVLKDSRCPVNVTCVWAGDAELELKVSKDKQQKTIVLHTGLEPRSATVMGLKLTLQRLEPENGAPGKPRAVFVVTKP